MSNVDKELLELAATKAIGYLTDLPERHVGATSGVDTMMKLLGGPLPEEPVPGAETIELLAEAATAGGVVASASPRYFGFVIGGTLPVSIATDWLVSAWDQCSGVFELGPAAATAEHIAA